MPEFVSVRQHEKSKTVVTVTQERADALGLETLDQPAVDGQNRPLGPRPLLSAISELRGQALDEALAAAGLAKSGTVKEKQQRLADHHGQED